MRPREWAKRAALASAGLLLAAVLAEVALRALGIGYPVFSRPDEDRGWALRPGAEGTYSAEGGSFVRISSSGWRDREHSREKPPGTLRIAILGDSFAEAQAVPMESAFWAVVESELRRLDPWDGRDVEVLNFGVRGYGTTQELLTLRCCALDYDPDLVVLALFTGNDLSDNSPVLDRSSTRYARPYLRLTEEEPEIDHSFRRSGRFRLGQLLVPLMAHSRLLQVGVTAHHRIFAKPVEGEATATRELGRGIGIDPPIYAAPRDEAWSEAWTIAEALLALMAQETDDRGGRFAVVTLSNPVQVHPDRELREAFRRELGVPDLDHPDRQVRAIGERHGFPVLNLAPELVAWVDEHGGFLHGFEKGRPGVGHWNELGHRLAGERIARWIADGMANPP